MVEGFVLTDSQTTNCKKLNLRNPTIFRFGTAGVLLFFGAQGSWALSQVSREVLKNFQTTNHITAARCRQACAAAPSQQRRHIPYSQSPLALLCVQTTHEPARGTLSKVGCSQEELPTPHGMLPESHIARARCSLSC